MERSQAELAQLELATRIFEKLFVERQYYDRSYDDVERLAKKVSLASELCIHEALRLILGIDDNDEDDEDDD